MATLGEPPGSGDEPLRVDDVGEVDAVEREEPRDWSRWAALALAFVLGVAATVVVTNARQQTAERSEISLVTAVGDLSAGSPSELEFEIMNAGSRAVDVVGLDVVGWTRAESAEVSAHASASEWTRADLLADVDCENRPDTTIDVTVRTAGVEETISVPLAERDHLDLTSFWSEACPTRPIATIQLEFAESVGLDPDRMVMEFELLQFDERWMQVVAVESATGGFSARARNLPLQLPPGEPTHLTVEWAVTDCDTANDVADVFVSLSVVGRQFGQTRSSLTADNRTLAELARLTALACET